MVLLFGGFCFYYLAVFGFRGFDAPRNFDWIQKVVLLFVSFCFYYLAVFGFRGFDALPMKVPKDKNSYLKDEILELMT